MHRTRLPSIRSSDRRLATPRRPRASRPTTRFRRLGCELLEDRRLLSLGPEGSAGAGPVQLFGVSPALFVENQGQWPDPSVRYAFQGSGANVLFTDTGPVFQVLRRDVAEQAEQPDGVTHRADPLANLAEHEETAIQSAQFSVTFEGGNLVEPVGLDRAETVYNYYAGDQSRWRSEVPTYETVAYLGLYDGIDLLTWGRRDSLKYEFHVAPGADWGQVRIRYEGIDGLVLDPLGNLHVQTSVGELVDDAPRVYQEIGGRQIDVPARFELVDAQSCRFVLTGDYDPSVELVIDPDLAWATYLGGSGDDRGLGIALDGAGNALVAGYTESLNFAGANNSYHGGGDPFVAKVSSGGSLAWATYLGGSGNDIGFEIAVDGDGNALVTGATLRR